MGPFNVMQGRCPLSQGQRCSGIAGLKQKRGKKDLCKSHARLFSGRLLLNYWTVRTHAESTRQPHMRSYCEKRRSTSPMCLPHDPHCYCIQFQLEVHYTNAGRPYRMQTIHEMYMACCSATERHHLSATTCTAMRRRQAAMNRSATPLHGIDGTRCYAAVVSRGNTGTNKGHRSTVHGRYGLAFTSPTQVSAVILAHTRHLQILQYSLHGKAWQRSPPYPSQAGTKELQRPAGFGDTCLGKGMRETLFARADLSASLIVREVDDQQRRLQTLSGTSLLL